MTDYPHWAPPADEELIDLRKQLADLQDEVTRLRASMGADVLREYDRRKAQV